MAKKILTIGLELDSEDVAHEDFTSRASLLDWDIVLFKPIIGEFISHNNEYMGTHAEYDALDAGKV